MFQASEKECALPRWTPASALAPPTDRALRWAQLLARALTCFLLNLQHTQFNPDDENLIS